MNYYWIRVFNYKFERDQLDKGIMLDEFYIKDVENKDTAKEIVRKKYCGDSSNRLLFAKPRKKDGLYAIVMDSSKFFYDRFYLEIDTYCFYCHKKIKGKAAEFPKINISSNPLIDMNLEDTDNIGYFCSYDCKNHLQTNLRYEGEFQEKEAGNDGTIFGYIYLMYNKAEDRYYIGQTRFLPFFRWQEHIKDGQKGNITDITFSVITEVKRNSSVDDSTNQENLNNIEAWWIAKYKEEGYEIFNISNPRLTLEDYKKKFGEMIAKEHQLSII